MSLESLKDSMGWLGVRDRRARDQEWEDLSGSSPIELGLSGKTVLVKMVLPESLFSCLLGCWEWKHTLVAGQLDYT